MLVNKCKNYDEDIKARSAQYKTDVENKGGKQFCGKPYLTPAEKEKQKKFVDGK